MLINFDKIVHPTCLYGTTWQLGPLEYLAGAVQVPWSTVLCWPKVPRKCLEGVFKKVCKNPIEIRMLYNNGPPTKI